MNIFLIGFMGSGKTTIGRNIALQLNRHFSDLDTEIEAFMGKTVPQIFTELGEESFRELESKLLEKVCSKDNQIISVGGGAPCFFKNMELMNKNGITIYLQMTPNAILERLWSLPENARFNRPLLANKTKTQLFEFITKSLETREAFYKRAQIIVSNDNNDVSIATGRILKAIEYANKPL